MKKRYSQEKGHINGSHANYGSNKQIINFEMSQFLIAKFLNENKWHSSGIATQTNMNVQKGRVHTRLHMSQLEMGTIKRNNIRIYWKLFS